MERVSTDSQEFKAMIRKFANERGARYFTYSNFVTWSTNKERVIVSHCGNASMGQAIFSSILKHEYDLQMTYRHATDGQLETVYQVEKIKDKKALFKRSIAPTPLEQRKEDASFEKLAYMN